MRTPLDEWQSQILADGGSFYEFCDALEVFEVLVLGDPVAIVPDASGWGLGHALVRWAEYSRDTLSTGEWVQ